MGADLCCHRHGAVLHRLVRYADSERERSALDSANVREGELVAHGSGQDPFAVERRRDKRGDTRKAERFFKERGIKFQSIDLKEKGLSKGEFNSVMQAVGGVDAMIDPDCKDKDLLALVTYISADERAEKVMENQSVIRQPIVRNGRQATVGYAPEVWKTWQ